MKTILLVSPYWKEKHRWMVSSFKLAELWRRMGFRVVVVCMGKKSGVECVSDMLTIYRRRDIFLPDPLNFGIAPGFSWYVWRVIKKEKPDLLICNKILFWSSFSLIPLRLLGYRFLLLTDALVGMTWWPRPFLAKGIMGLGAWTVGWLVLLCAEKIVFFHPQPPRLLRCLGIQKKSTMIPTGIDAAEIPNSTRLGEVSAKRSEVVRSRKFQIPNSKEHNIVVTYVGRLESVKGVDDFLAAVVPLKKNHPSLTVQVVGWYRENHPLVEQYRHSVSFMGLRDDVLNILAGTDIFVLPSYSEGLSNALMEAMASACACIATDVGGNRYLIQNGVSGFLFSPGDREALKSHVRRLIEDRAKRMQMGTAARERIEKEFDWSTIGAKYEGLFAECI